MGWSWKLCTVIGLDGTLISAAGVECQAGELLGGNGDLNADASVGRLVNQDQVELVRARDVPLGENAEAAEARTAGWWAAGSRYGAPLASSSSTGPVAVSMVGATGKAVGGVAGGV